MKTCCHVLANQTHLNHMLGLSNEVHYAVSYQEASELPEVKGFFKKDLYYSIQL